MKNQKEIVIFVTIQDTKLVNVLMFQDKIQNQKQIQLEYDGTLQIYNEMEIDDFIKDGGLACKKTIKINCLPKA